MVEMGSQLVAVGIVVVEDIPAAEVLLLVVH